MWDYLKGIFLVNATEDKFSMNNGDAPTVYQLQRESFILVVSKFQAMKSIFDQKKLTVEDRGSKELYDSFISAVHGADDKYSKLISGDFEEFYKDKNGNVLNEVEAAKVTKHLHNLIDGEYQNIYSWLESKEFFFEKDKKSEGGLIKDPLTKQIIKFHPLEALALHDFQNEMKNATLAVNAFDMINNIESLTMHLNALSSLDDGRPQIDAIRKELKIAPAIKIGDKNAQMSSIQDIPQTVLNKIKDKGVKEYAKRLNNYAHHFFTEPQSGNALVYGPINFIFAMNIFGGASFFFNQTATFANVFFDVFDKQATRLIKGFNDPDFVDSKGHQSPYKMATNVVNDTNTGEMRVESQKFWKRKAHMLSDELNNMMKTKFGFEFDVYKKLKSGEDPVDIKLTQSDVVREIGYHESVTAAETLGPGRHYDGLNVRAIGRFYELAVKSGLVAMPKSFVQLEPGELFEKDSKGKYKTQVDVGSLDEAHFLCGIIATRHPELNMTYADVFKVVAASGVINIVRKEKAAIEFPTDNKVTLPEKPMKPDPAVKPLEVETYLGQMNIAKYNIPKDPQRAVKIDKNISGMFSVATNFVGSVIRGIPVKQTVKIALACTVAYLGYKAIDSAMNVNTSVVQELTGEEYEKVKANLIRNNVNLQSIKTFNDTRELFANKDTISINNHERIFVISPGTEIEFEKGVIKKNKYEENAGFKLKEIDTNGKSIIFKRNGNEYEVSGAKGFIENILSQNDTDKNIKDIIKNRVPKRYAEKMDKAQDKNNTAQATERS